METCFSLISSDLFITVVSLSLFDIFLGTMRAFVNGEVSSNISKKGITNHIVTILTIVVMNWVLVNLGYSEFCKVFIMFYIGSYLISIVENLNKLGVPFPEKFVNLFSTLKDEGKVKNENQRNG